MAWMPQFVMFWDPAPTVVSIFVYFLIFKFLYYVSHTVAVVPYYALGAELSTDYQERTRIVAWRHMIGVPVIILATLPYMLATNPGLFPDEQTGIAIVMLFVGIIIISTGIVTSLGTRESVRTERNPPVPIMRAIKITLSNRPFIFLVITVLIYGIGQYFSVSFAAYLITYVIYEGDKGAFATLLFQATVLGVMTSMGLNLLIRRLGKRIEKVRLLKVCMGLSLLVPVAALFSFDPEQPYLYFVFHALALPIGNTMIEILPLSIVADVCDIDEVKSGRRREGAFVGVYNAAFKSGYLLAPSLTMFLLAMTGFEGLAPQQTVETQELLKYYMMAGTGIPFALAFLLSLGIGLRRSEVDDAQQPTFYFSGNYCADLWDRSVLFREFCGIPDHVRDLRRRQRSICHSAISSYRSRGDDEYGPQSADPPSWQTHREGQAFESLHGPELVGTGGCLIQL